MIKFDFGYLEKISAKEGVRKAEWKKFAGKIPDFLKAFKNRDQRFLEELDKKETIEKIKNFTSARKGNYRDIVVLGIGGSALGANCVQQALGQIYPLDEKKTVHLTVLDNIDPVLLLEFEQVLDWKKTLFVVISKSGETAETLAQFLYFKNKCTLKKLDWKKHFVLVTGARGLLRDLLNKSLDLAGFDIPEKVGGRFSALTMVGLLPLALSGYDIGNLLKGARQGKNRSMEKVLAKNPAFQLALAQYLLYRKGKKQLVFFPYAQKLLGVGDWYRQLLAESIGKEKNRAGRRVNIGITPVTALGVTDQHSQNQLYMEGPADKLYVLAAVSKPLLDAKIPLDRSWRPAEMEYLGGVTFNQLLLAEMEGTIQALLKKNRPVVRISLEKLDALAVGELMVILEMSVVFLGELFNIDAFNQPGVELSKELTKSMLKNRPAGRLP
jgi:glucose-6-phosphate isomerase